MPGVLSYKIADSEVEFEAIHRLNHRTFVEEIPQHPADSQGRLVDRFHSENTYAVCLDGDVLVGMVAGRQARPFSLDAKVADLDRYLPVGRVAVEIRLLAVDRSYRNGGVLARLVEVLAAHFRNRGCDLAVISGTTRALSMYRRLGFVPFGPLAGAAGAQFQPMYLTLEATRHHRWADSGAKQTGPESFLPGPVAVAPQVADAFAQPPLYHRSTEFRAVTAAVHARLAEFAGAPHAQLLLGSGTLANDAVAYQLARLNEPGVIATNGEFGDRLVDHATRVGLRFTVVSAPWGQPIDWSLIERELTAQAACWLWTVHCETSTGTLVDLPQLTTACQQAGVRLCVDCISSIGTVPLDLSGAFLATGASGKALGSYPGLSIVFSQGQPEPAPVGIPRYLDLGSYASADGIAFTQSSNLVYALDAALGVHSWPDRYRSLATAADWLRARLDRLGFGMVAPVGHTAPGVCTVVLPASLDAEVIGTRMIAEGYLLAYHSSYLRRRNWLQISLMGSWTWPTLRALPATLARVCSR